MAWINCRPTSLVRQSRSSNPSPSASQALHSAATSSGKNWPLSQSSQQEGSCATCRLVKRNRGIVGPRKKRFRRRELAATPAAARPNARRRTRRSACPAAFRSPPPALLFHPHRPHKKLQPQGRFPEAQATALGEGRGRRGG